MARATASAKLICCLVFMMSAAALYAEVPTARTVSVKVVLDSSLGNINLWRTEARSCLNECIGVFNDQFGIKLEIREYGSWDPRSGQTPLEEAISDLKNHVSSGGCDLVLGIISPNHTTHSVYGMSDYIDGYILLVNINPTLEVKYVLLHELCHIFGAIDIREKGSIMSMSDAGFRFDEFTRQAVLLNKCRLFDHVTFPVPKENLNKAIALFKERRDLHLDEPEVSLYTALLCLEKKDFESASRICQEMAKTNPKSLGIHNILGSIYFQCGDFDQAIAEYQQACELQPGAPAMHCNLGLAYFEKGIVEAAESEYRKALRLNADYSPAHSSLGCLYLMTRKLDACINECTAALKIDPVLPEALCLLGCALLLKNEPTLSADPIERTGEWDPDLMDVAASRPADRAIQDAAALCQKAISIKPSIPEAHNALGAALAYQKKFAEAEAEFLKALEINRNDEEAHYNLALFYYTKGETEKAGRHLGRFLEINPSSDLGLQILSQIFRSQKSFSVFPEKTKR